MSGPYTQVEDAENTPDRAPEASPVPASDLRSMILFGFSHGAINTGLGGCETLGRLAIQKINHCQEKLTEGPCLLS